MSRAVVVLSSNASKRLALTLVDQAFSSASNMLMILGVARITAPRQFGEIVLTYTGLVAFLALGRGAFGTNISLKASDRLIRAEASHASGAALILSLPVIAATTAAGVSGVIPGASALLLSVLPFMLIQDVSRYALTALRKPGLAVISDGIWFLCSAMGVVLTLSGNPSVIHLLVLWITGGVVACGIAIAASHARPQISGVREWLRSDLADRRRYAVEAAAGATTALILAAIVGAFISLDGTAALRGAATIIGPLNVALSAVPLALVPELRRLQVQDPPPRRAILLRKVSPIALSLSGLAGSIGLLAIVLPERAGTALLGDTWNLASPIMPIVAIEYIAHGWFAVAGCILRSANSSRSVVRLGLAQATVTLLGGCAAAIVSHSAIVVAIWSAATGWCLAATAIRIALQGPGAEDQTKGRLAV